ncbi:hypothetical protein B0H17DRAFT_1230186 [Mycena rosella]|uniref:Uncharacterized protein n=1 Tax=Mycena rosella TaxID=1033263 RepID=A0AAD7D714_MYCRO|nr:hypothetical protein B0H17DRAFT_1230186 [Mycena rosella]
MATETGTGSKHTPADREYLDSLSARLLMEFRNYVDMELLREFLQQPAQNFTPDASMMRQSVSDSIRIKIEATPSSAPVPVPPTLVKAEPRVASVPRASANVEMHALHEGGREVFQLLSDSEPEADDSDLEVLEALQHTSRSSSAIPLPNPKRFLDDNSDSAEPEPRSESSDVWLDDGTSLARIGPFRPTRKITVACMEYRQGPAAIYPILRTPTDQMYWFRDPTTKELYTFNTIIMNADNDSWAWSGGGINQTAIVTFAPGEKAVKCRRIRYKCVGAHACDHLDKALRSVIRFELDLAPRDAIIAAQQETRRRERNSPEDFIKIASRGHQYFVGCSGWTTKFRIPDNVDENLVANALAELPLSNDLSKDTPPCSGIIHPHTGGKKNIAVLFFNFSIASDSTNSLLAHDHTVNGMQVQGKIQNYPCPATRSIYVPKDLSVRKVLIVHNDTGHNHPMPALTKLWFGLKDTYRGCIKSKTPPTYAPPLHNKRVKRDILHAERIEKYPNGLAIDDIRLMYHAEKLTKPLPERYIHSYIETEKGEIIILTFVPYLLKLLDDPGVTSFDGDTTYKGIESKLNEWELSLFAKVVQRGSFFYFELKKAVHVETGHYGKMVRGEGEILALLYKRGLRTS